MKIKVGDVVKIRYKNDVKVNGINTILIVNKIEGRLVAVWYEGDDYDGKPYIISPNQEIIEIVERGVNISEVKNNEIMGAYSR